MRRYPPSRNYPSIVLLQGLPARVAEWIAARALRAAVRHGDPEGSLALLYYQLAMIALRRRHHDRAEDFLKRAIAADPGMASMYHIEIGRIRKIQGDYAGAAVHLRSGLDTLPGDVSTGYREWLIAELRVCSDAASKGR